MSKFFISALESPIAPLLAKHLLQDIDYLVKLSIRVMFSLFFFKKSYWLFNSY
jgi:hypothetical protein